MGEPAPYQILVTCLQRNYGLGDTHIHQEMKTVRNGKNEYTMIVNKKEVSVICKNKKDGKQLLLRNCSNSCTLISAVGEACSECMETGLCGSWKWRRRKKPKWPDSRQDPIKPVFHHLLQFSTSSEKKWKICENPDKTLFLLASLLFRSMLDLGLVSTLIMWICSLTILPMQPSSIIRFSGINYFARNKL